MGSIADKIRTAQDKDGMLRRALERIIQLYTDRSHFVYELLQNAEDAEATCVEFIQYPDRLEVMHDGKPFTSANLQGLCDIGKSDKIDNLNQIGEFGVGFKSVFGICDTVLLYSKPKNFRTDPPEGVVPFAVEIIDFTTPKDIEPAYVGYPYTTKFVFPYTVGKTFSGFKSISELNVVLSRKLQNLGITTLLFMKNLELIKYQIKLDDNVIEGQYLLEKEEINEHCSLVSALGVSETQQSEKMEEFSYLKFSKKIDASSSRTVDIAFPVIVDSKGNYECQKPNDPFISVYFPTETESKLGFIVQGPYRTTPNRSSIPADDEDNIKLAAKTAELLKETIKELCDAGKFNMSFVKALPLNPRSFDNYKLFYPLYETVKSIFTRDKVLPRKDGGYVKAQYAKIARQERLASIFSDKLLSSLINDGAKYHWLPTYLTETNKEYEAVYRYLTVELKVPVIRPEDLRIYFNSNPAFLKAQSDDWLVSLYSVLENVAAAFSKNKNETNMLTANIIKTSTGEFVAAYRKTENKQYIANVFLPSPKIKSPDIHFVDQKIYEKCRHFFDNILQLHKPNEYEFFIKDIKKRYTGTYAFEEAKHIEDVKNLYKYLKYEEYQDEVKSVLKDDFLLRCSDGIMRNAYRQNIYLPISPSGINIEGYLKNIAKNAYFIDIDFYYSNGISYDILMTFGARASLLKNENTQGGTYYTGNGGRQPDWWTAGDFRWKLTIEYLNEVLQYIAEHPSASDSIIKSKTILSILFENESKLVGTVRIGGATPNLENEPCEAIRIIRREKSRNWNGKWLYAKSMDLVAAKDVSKHDISTDIYGAAKQDSRVYELLQFRKTADDEVDDLKKTVPKSQLDAYFENELRNRFGVSSSDLSKHFSGRKDSIHSDVIDEELLFPAVRVKNWDTLRKHAAEMLCYANPVKYDYVVRKIRVSNRPKEIRSYLMGMYRYDGAAYKYACQMCHKSTSNFENVQLFNEQDTELDPMHLCMCPNCAAEYRRLRKNDSTMQEFQNAILSIHETLMAEDDHISIPIEKYDIWFSQVHLAEIQTLIRFKNEVRNEDKPKSAATSSVSISTETERSKEKKTEERKTSLSVYNQYVGKTICRNDGFTGEVIRVDDVYLYVKVTNKGKRGNIDVGKETKLQLKFVLAHPKEYVIG